MYLAGLFCRLLQELDPFLDTADVQQYISHVRPRIGGKVEVAPFHALATNGIQHPQSLGHLSDLCVTVAHRHDGEEGKATPGQFLDIGHGFLIHADRFSKAPLPEQKERAEGCGRSHDSGVIQFFCQGPPFFKVAQGAAVARPQPFVFGHVHSEQSLGCEKIVLLGTL